MADDVKSVVLCSSGIVFTARISDPSEGDGEVNTPDDTFGIDNVLFAVVALAEVEVATTPTSGVDIVVAGVEADDGRTSDLILSSINISNV